jgi:hypothetical protein
MVRHRMLLVAVLTWVCGAALLFATAVAPSARPTMRLL